jgi:ferredoxin
MELSEMKKEVSRLPGNTRFKQMNFLLLKRLRVALSVFFLVLLAAVFIDFRKSFSAEFYQWSLSLQFVPSLLKTITLPGISAIGLIVVLLLTVMYGRVYCAALCPLGILQDVVSWISGKTGRQKRYKYHKAWTMGRYTLLVITVAPLLFGSITLVTLLDPYSLFGRIATFVFKPIVVIVNNLFAAGFAKADIYNWLYRYDLVPLHPAIMVITTIFLGGIGWMAYNRGRLYCNTVCPVGTFLGFISRFAIFKIVINKSQCTHCGKCARVCKAECIETKSQKIDYSRCVACCNCLTVCSEQAMAYKPFKGKPYAIPEGLEPKPAEGKAQGVADLSKRSFLVSAVVGVASLYGFKAADSIQGDKKPKLIVPKPKGESTLPEKKTSAVSPPGSRAIERFNKICTGCSLCVSACPTKVLQPSFLQYGLIGMMQPHMDYHKGLCEFDCTLCSEVCPTGAIAPITMEAKHLLQVGQVHFEKNNCIVETEKTDCGACSEHCPTKAVHMVPYGKLFIPEIDQKICVGCGACEYACPTTPFKAIYVNGNPVHLAAEKPKTEKAKNGLKEGEFPF